MGIVDLIRPGAGMRRPIDRRRECFTQVGAYGVLRPLPDIALPWLIRL